MNTIDKVFGDKIKLLRNKRRLSQEGLAYKAKMVQSDISKIENGNVRGGKDMVQRLADALEVPFEFLIRNTSFAVLSEPNPLVGIDNADQSEPIIAYFASALTGLNESQEAEVKEIDEEVYKICSEYTRYNVALYRPRLKTSPKDNPDVSAQEVYEIDRERVATSDILFLSTIYPSLGAGMEIQLGLQSCSSIILLKKKNQPLSRMVLGCPARLEIVEYDSITELKDKVINAMDSLLPTIAEFRFTHLNQDTSLDYEFGKRVQQLRQQRNFTADRLARMIGVGVSYIESLETASERIVNPSIEIIRRIAKALLTTEAFLVSGQQGMDERLLSHSSELKNLAKETGMSVEDFDFLWTEHIEIYRNDLSMIGIENRAEVGTAKYWKEKYEQHQKEKSNGGKLFY